MNILSSEKIRECLRNAVTRFNDVDAPALLCPRKNDKGDYVRTGSGWGAASERAIAHRLAVYLEAAFNAELGEKGDRISIDCEYNRHLGAGKIHTIPERLVEIVEDAKRTAKPVSDDDSFYVFSIAPDIIVHERGNDDHNLLVIELKKDSNPEIPEYDNLKLQCFTAEEPGYQYHVGAKITAHDKLDPVQRSLEITAWYSEGAERREAEI